MADINFPSGGIFMATPESPRPNVRRTEFEGGDIKQSRISQVLPFQHDITIIYTAEEYADFKSWFRYEALDGSQFFNATDQVDGVTKEFRIINGVFKGMPNKTGTHYTVTMQWEMFDAFDPPEED